MDERVRLRGAARVVAVHQGGGVGGAPVSLLKLLQHLPDEVVRA